MSHSGQFAINYFGSSDLLTNPLYTKWSKTTIAEAKVAKTDLQDDLDGILLMFDNLEIISYLSSVLRAVALTT